MYSHSPATPTYRWPSYAITRRSRISLRKTCHKWCRGWVRKGHVSSLSSRYNSRRFKRLGWEKNRTKGERKGVWNQSSENLRHGNNCSAPLLPTSFFIVLSVRNHGYIFCCFFIWFCFKRYYWLFVNMRVIILMFEFINCPGYLWRRPAVGCCIVDGWVHHQYYTTTYAAPSYYTEASKYYCVHSYYTKASANYSSKTVEYYTGAPKNYSAPIYTTTTDAPKYYAAPTYYTEAAPSTYVEQKYYTDVPGNYTTTYATWRSSRFHSFLLTHF